MSGEAISARVRHKGMTKSEWEASDIILPKGELVYESDTGHSKFGDGKNQYEKLKYQGGPPGPQGPQGPPGPAASIPDDVVRRGELAAYLLRSEYKAKGTGSGLSYKVVTQSEYDELYDYSDNELILVVEG